MFLWLASVGSELVPPRDELGLPGPLWLFQVLLPASFALHVVFMNYAMGASLVLPVAWGVGLRRGAGSLPLLARAMVRVWPVAISLTITTGVAPLLFVQVLYGHMFYTANILLGWRWLGMLGLLILSFYGVYMLDRAMQARRVAMSYSLMVVLAAALLMIAHEFNNNSVLMLRPALWRDMHDGLLNRHARDAMWAPRMVHTVIGSLAITGLWIAGIARWAAAWSAEGRRAIAGLGLRIAAIATVVQVLSGLWFFVALDTQVQRALFTFSRPGSLLWALAVLGGVVSIVLLYKSSERPEARGAFAWPAVVVGLVLLGMSAGREVVRMESLAPIPGSLYGAADAKAQPGPMLMFAATLVLGVAVVLAMLRWVARMPASTQTADLCPGEPPDVQSGLGR